ncbi:MAG: DUF7562 family protein [Halobacteriota archaeon]
MWGRRDRTEIVCIACGDTLDRTDAREYDKHGDRWDRIDKEFEYLCKPCHRDLCHHPRRGLESLLVALDGESSSARRFVERYYDALDRSLDADGGDERERNS